MRLLAALAAATALAALPAGGASAGTACQVASADGGPVLRPFWGAGTWAPRVDLMAAITSGGGIVVAGFDRYTTPSKSLVAATAPAWRARTIAGGALSWVSPTCSRVGTHLAASAGPNGIEQRFGGWADQTDWWQPAGG